MLKARGHFHRAVALGGELFQGQRATLHYLTANDLQEAWQLFCRFRDKEWSFTDRTSKVVIAKLGVTTAFAFDQHFRQFGSVLVVP